MPYIQVDLPTARSETDFSRFAQSIAELYAGLMQTYPDGVTVAVRELGAGRVIRGGRPHVAIRCDIRGGRPDAQRDSFASALTELVARYSEQLGSEESVIYFTESPGRFIFEHGEPNADWSPEEAVS